MKTIAERITAASVQTCHVCFESGHEAKDCPEQKADFAMVGPIAAFIAARLNYSVPSCNSPRKYVGRDISTIYVSQHKEKFWHVVIYCELADPDLVNVRWMEEKKETDPQEPPQEFIDKCFRYDALHYRRVYCDMLNLLPARMRKRVVDRAAYEELLHESVEQMEARIDDIEAQDLQHAYAHDNLKTYRERYGAETNLELKEKLRALYGELTFKERIESSDT